MASPKSRPAILALAQCLPYPPHTGVTNRVYHILTGLQSRFDVFLVPFFRRFHHPDQGAILEARDALRRELTWTAGPIPIPAERHRIRRVLNHFASVFSGQPYVRFEYAASGFGAALREAVATRAPSLIHAESLDLYSWFSGLPRVPLTLTHHSVESDLLRTRALMTPGAHARAYLRLQARRLERLEREWAPRVAANVMMSDVDEARLCAVAPGASTVVVPNGVDVEYFAPASRSPQVRGKVIFIGPTYVYQNRDAVDWFLDSIWPRVRRLEPEATLDLIGGAREGDSARYAAHSGVTVCGQVKDVRPFLESASCSVVPLRIGGGTRLKILDAWAMETPVVSTVLGCEGLKAVDGENIIIRDDPDAFADAVVSVLQSPPTGRRLGTAGRSTAESVYSWDVITGRLADYYAALIG